MAGRNNGFFLIAKRAHISFGVVELWPASVQNQRAQGFWHRSQLPSFEEYQDSKRMADAEGKIEIIRNEANVPRAA